MRKHNPRFKKALSKIQTPKVHQPGDSDNHSYSSEVEIQLLSAENAVNSVEMTDYKKQNISTHGTGWCTSGDASRASCNLLSRNLLPKDSVIDRAEVKLTTYSKASLKVLGVTKVQLRTPKIRRSTMLKLLLLRKITHHSLALYLRRRWD